MKNRLLKPISLVVLSAVLIALCSAFSGKRFLQGRYTQSNTGTFCYPMTTVPDVCTPSVTAQLCVTPSGTTTATWYNDACQTPYYRVP